MSSELKYTLVDDDYLCNTISTMMLEDTFGYAEIKAFTKAENALEYIEREYSKMMAPTILFLDINMPTMDDWQFLEQYGKFSEAIKKQIKIYILSSSIARKDRNKAELDKNVVGFLSKPLDNEVLTSISGKEF